MVDFNEIIKRRTKKNVISEIIAIVVFALLNIAFKAYSIEYNVDLLKEQDVYTPYVHKFCETINPKIALKDFVCYDRRLEVSINTICENEVGKTLIRRMYDAYLSNLNNGIFKPVKIFRDCVLLDGILERNITCHYDSEIKIYIDPDNLSSYVGYKNGNIEEMPSTLDSVIFHEMCHAFHDLTSSLKLDSKIPTLKHTYSYSKKDCVYLWTNKDKPNDEELYNKPVTFMKTVGLNSTL